MDVVEPFLFALLGQVVAGPTILWAFVKVKAANDIVEFFLSYIQVFQRSYIDGYMIT